jgi:hypothetical protein
VFVYILCGLLFCEGFVIELKGELDLLLFVCTACLLIGLLLYLMVFDTLPRVTLEFFSAPPLMNLVKPFVVILLVFPF